MKIFDILNHAVTVATTFAMILAVILALTGDIETAKDICFPIIGIFFIFDIITGDFLRTWRLIFKRFKK